LTVGNVHQTRISVTNALQVTNPAPSTSRKANKFREVNVLEKLSTIQKRENLNTVFVLDEKGNGGANHSYQIDLQDGNDVCNIQFQNGARKLPDSIHGVLDTDLLEIVRHRLQCFQEGPFSSEYNRVALSHVEQALMWMNRRVEDRIERNVLGTNNK